MTRFEYVANSLIACGLGLLGLYLVFIGMATRQFPLFVVGLFELGAMNIVLSVLEAEDE